MTLIRIRGTLSTFSQAINPVENDVIRNEGERFRVVAREWIHEILHCDVVPIVEREDDEPQVQSATDDG